jgi:bifunctional DNA-binding transcriptional regulator/antitoxin component of YhaV-PrlF toxin-antitoxin module
MVMMKATTMTLSEKRQSVFPQDWCERVGLARGGQVNVFDLGEHGLLIRPVKSPTRRELAAALAAARPRRSKPGEAERIVARALRKVRFTCLSLNGRYALGGGGDNAAVRRALARRAYEKHR